MLRLRYVKAFLLLGLLAATSSGCGGCFGGYNMLGIPLFSMKIEVRGPSNAPLIGAVVSCSSGETVTVDSTGIAKLNFSDAGPYYISVRYQDNIIASYNVSMPSDGGKTLTANYVPPSANAPAAAPSGGENAGLAMMATRLYPILFQYMFSAYGYSLEMVPYRPGQYTDWSMMGENGTEFRIHKAFLTQLPDGKKWWQMNYISGKEDTMMIEVLFSENQQSIRRMRQKWAGEAPKEVPVTEGWYTSPMQLTPESIEGAVVKKGVSVTVPAGSFTCDQLEFGVAPGMTLRLFRAVNVPGGVVKYEMIHEGNDLYSGELSAYGTGATTQLGSY